MSAAKLITDMGATVALVDGKVKLAGLDRLPAEIATRVVAAAREHVAELRRELDPTGLGWSPWPAEDGDPDFEGKWAVFDLRDACRSCKARIVRAGERILAFYPPSLGAGMVEYAEDLLDDARGYLAANLDKLPVLTPAEAVERIKEVMRAHPGLRFTRGDGDSIWPLYPKDWSAGQKMAVQSLWLVAGPNLDHDAFKEIDR
ncbi:hypothetical protein [Solidesulfovibrio sp.]